MKDVFMDGQASLMSLRDVLARVSAECRELGEFTDRFQHILSPALAHLRLDDQAHQDVQALDRLSQSLAALAGYIEAIGGGLPDDLKIDAREALAKIPMVELQRRLKGAPVSADSAHLPGELELF